MGISMFEAEDAAVSELICNAQSVESNDTPAMRELIRRYTPLAHRVVNELNPHPNVRDDMFNGALWGIVQAVKNHDGRESGFASFLTRYMRGEAKRAIERSANDELPFSPDMLPVVEVAQHEQADPPVIPTDRLTEKQRTLVKLVYWDEKSYADIARTEGTSLSAVRQRVQTVHRTIATMMATAA